MLIFVNRMTLGHYASFSGKSAKIESQSSTVVVGYGSPGIRVKQALLHPVLPLLSVLRYYSRLFPSVDLPVAYRYVRTDRGSFLLRLWSCLLGARSAAAGGSQTDETSRSNRCKTIKTGDLLEHCFYTSFLILLLTLPSTIELIKESKDKENQHHELLE